MYTVISHCFYGDFIDRGLRCKCIVLLSTRRLYILVNVSFLSLSIYILFITVQVLEIKAANRTGSENFMSCIRKALAEEYGDKPVSLGGTFCMQRGKCRMHVMVRQQNKVVLRKV